MDCFSMSILETLLRKGLKELPVKRGNPPNLQMRKPNGKGIWLLIHCNCSHWMFQKQALVTRKRKQQGVASKEKLVQMHSNHKTIKVNETPGNGRRTRKGRQAVLTVPAITLLKAIIHLTYQRTCRSLYCCFTLVLECYNMFVPFIGSRLF
jgi:hypothetical protein